MVDLGPITNGVDGTVTKDAPNRVYPSGARVSAAGGTGTAAGARRILLYQVIPPMIAGRSVVSAVLSNRVMEASASRTVVVTPLSAKYAAAEAKWNDHPGVRANPVSTTVIPAASEGDRIELDVTALVQAVADGVRHFGWRLTATGSSPLFLASFEGGGLDAWHLDLVISDVPEAPSNQSPFLGAIGTPKPTFRCDYTTLGEAEVGSIQVRVNGTKTSVGAWDSGVVDSTEPSLDTTGTSYTAPTNVDQYWQMRVRPLTDAGAGEWSDWSDWAGPIEYDPKPTLTIDSPTGGTISDPTPTVLAHLSEPGKRFVIKVVTAGDRSDERYNSGRLSMGGSANLGHEVPLRDPNEDRVIFKDDGNYELLVRCFDRDDRISGGPGDLPYIQEWVPITFDDDAGVLSPSILTFTQPVAGVPRVRLEWKRSELADAWDVYRNDERVARLGGVEASVGGGTYRWVDDSVLPNQAVTYAVRAIEYTGSVAKASKRITRATEVEVHGVWILTGIGDVQLSGPTPRVQKLDRRQTFEMPYRSDPVDIITALGTVTGDFDGYLVKRFGEPEPNDVAVLINRIKKRYAALSVRLVWGTRNIPVVLRDLTAEASVADDATAENQKHDVTFGFFQSGDFD